MVVVLLVLASQEKFLVSQPREKMGKNGKMLPKPLISH
jgi:hypothetical protein